MKSLSKIVNSLIGELKGNFLGVSLSTESFCSRATIRGSYERMRLSDFGNAYSLQYLGHRVLKVGKHRVTNIFPFHPRAHSVMKRPCLHSPSVLLRALPKKSNRCQVYNLNMETRHGKKPWQKMAIITEMQTMQNREAEPK
jgi:hypothetical protein